MNKSLNNAKTSVCVCINIISLFFIINLFSYNFNFIKHNMFKVFPRFA